MWVTKHRTENLIGLLFLGPPPEINKNPISYIINIANYIRGDCAKVHLFLAFCFSFHPD